MHLSEYTSIKNFTDLKNNVISADQLKVNRTGSVDQLKVTRTLTREITVIITHLFIHSFFPFLLKFYHTSNTLLRALDTKKLQHMEEGAVKLSATN